VRRIRTEKILRAILQLVVDHCQQVLGLYILLARLFLSRLALNTKKKKKKEKKEKKKKKKEQSKIMFITIF
jgi:hypothetical protein